MDFSSAVQGLTMAMGLFNRGGNIRPRKNQVSLATSPCVCNYNVFVGGLGRDANDITLREAFSVYGEVLKAKAVMDRNTGRCRGFGFVTFDNPLSAVDSIRELDQWVLNGRTVTVRWAYDWGNMCSDSDDTDSNESDYSDSDLST